jgi:rod shape-determining protein MreB
MRIQSIAPRSPELGIDLGTANTLVVAAGAGLLFDQPSVCCFRAYDAVPSFVAAGAEAHLYVGKVAKPLKIIRPLHNGVLSDMAAARELLSFVQRSIRRKPFYRRLRPLIGIPADSTQAEQRALITAAKDAGFAEPVLMAEPVLAAQGLGISIGQPRGRMIVDCGAGTTEVVVISLGEICVSRSVRGGGSELDRSLADHLHSRHRFEIGHASAESLKLKLSAMLRSGDSDAEVEVAGLDTATGLPRLLSIPLAELLGVWDRHLDQIAGAVEAALGETAPELCNDIHEDGITLTGGAASTSLLADRVAERTGIRTRIADEPLLAVAKGLQRVLEGCE